MRDYWHLHQVDWLQQLSEAEMTALQRASSVREYAPEDMVFAPNASPQSVYLLVRGLVRVYRLSGDGEETTFGYVSPGEVFGELVAFGASERESFAQATRRSTIWKIPRKTFQAALTAHPEMILEVTKQIGHRMKRIENRVENLVFRDVRSRVARVLCDLADDFGQTEGEQVVIDFVLTQSELGTLVGSTRQTVNASLRQLEAEGLLGRRGRRLVLLKPDALRAAARGRPLAAVAPGPSPAR